MFLKRVDTPVIILDEPDVYMHPDLQHKLISLLFNLNKQIILTTHSTEIISDVEPENILLLNRRSNESLYTDSLPGVQKIIDKIGGVHNLQLTRLWSSKKCLFVEGKDIKLLSIFQKILYPNTETPIKLLPNMSIGGWGGWSYVIGVSSFLKNSFGNKVTTYCILDSDYHSPEEISKRLDDAESKEIHLVIWGKKEIENYLIVPKAIQRLIKKRNNKSLPSPNVGTIEKQVEKIADNIKSYIFDSFSESISYLNKGKGTAYSNKIARSIVDEKWKTREGKFSLIPGKETISTLSNWSQEKYGVSLNPISIAQNLKREDIHDDIFSLMTDIEYDV